MFKPLCYPSINILPLDVIPDTTDYELVMHLINLVNQLISAVNDLENGLISANQAIEELQKTVAEILDEITKIKNGEYVDLYLDSIIHWIDANLQNLVAKIVKYIFFGLTDDGHFAAYIPDSWDFLNFSTPINPSDPNYGHLVLTW